MSLFVNQMQYAWQSLKKRPGLLFNMAMTIGLTLGALICALTLVYFMNFKSLAYQNADYLHMLNADWLNQDQQHQTQGISHEQAEFLYKQNSEQLGIALSYNVAS